MISKEEYTGNYCIFGIRHCIAIGLATKSENAIFVFDSIKKNEERNVLQITNEHYWFLKFIFQMKISRNKVYSCYTANKVVILHTVMGAGIFYFLIHPLTMVMYWFEFHENHQVNLSVADIITKRWLHAFSFHMTGMSAVFLLMGVATGLGFGFYYRNMQKKNSLVRKQEYFLNLSIEQTIQIGENEYTEFKSSLRYDYAKKNTNKELEIVIAKTIAGFMNANGGKLVIGISDKGEILGLENDYFTLKHKNRDGFERRVYEIVNQYLGVEFCSFVHIYFYRKFEKDFCAVEIVKAPVPVYVNSEKDSSFYLRTGNATIMLTVKETINYIKLK